MTIRHYRFPVVFPEPEREILEQLCNMDYRSPELQLRYLVMSEAQRRGLVKAEHADGEDKIGGENAGTTN